LSFGPRLRGLNLLVHLGGALLAVSYFHWVNPAAIADGAPVTGSEIAFLVLAFGLLNAILRRIATRSLAAVARGECAAGRPAG
jgi:hypothetical protein